MVRSTFRNIVAIATCAATVMGVGTSAIAQDAKEMVDPLALSSSQAADLKMLTCWEVVTLSEDDRAFAMTLLYGYNQGSKSDSSITPRDIQIAIINTMQNCVDTPEAKVLDVLRSHVAHEDQG